MNKAVTVIKFMYLYLAYWFVGLTEEDFYISKGNYFADLGKYYSAINSYKKALKEDELFSLYAMIGWCYAALEDNELALKNYRKAYERIKRHDIAVTLARLEMEHGDVNQCRKIFENLIEGRDELPEESKKVYDEIQEFLVHQEMKN